MFTHENPNYNPVWLVWILWLQFTNVVWYEFCICSLLTSLHTQRGLWALQGYIRTYLLVCWCSGGMLGAGNFFQGAGRGWMGVVEVSIYEGVGEVCQFVYIHRHGPTEINFICYGNILFEFASSYRCGSWTFALTVTLSYSSFFVKITQWTANGF